MRSQWAPPGLAKLLEIHYLSTREDVWRQFVREPLVGFDDIIRVEGNWKQPSPCGHGIPSGVASAMRKRDFYELTHSCRLIYHSKNVVIKLALDGEGLKQNFLESYFYQEKAGDVIGKKAGRWTLELPAMLETHPKCYWIVQQLVGGRIATKTDIDQDVQDFFQQLGVGDCLPKNFKVWYDCLWPVDLGCYLFDPVAGDYMVPQGSQLRSPQ